MALKAGYKGIKEVGPGLKLDVTGRLSLEGSPGPGGDGKLKDLEDVNITSPLDGDLLQYDATNEEWINIQPDSTPTEDSPDPVSSGGVYEALALKADASDVEAIEVKIPSSASPSNKMATADDVASRVDWSSYAKTGAVNICKLLDGINSYVLDKTVDYNTGTVTIKGTPTSTGWSEGVVYNIILPAGTYKARCTSQTGNLNLLLNWEPQGVVTSEGIIFTTDGTKTVKFAWNVTNGTAVDYSAVGVMITTPNYKGDYVPYAMTNRELTDAFNVKNDTTQISSTNMTINQCAIAKAGRIRVCTIVAQANSDIPANTIIMNDFPDKVLINYDATMNIVANTSAGVEYRLLSFTSGGVLGIKTMIAIPTGTSIRFTFTYICE